MKLPPTINDSFGYPIMCEACRIRWARYKLNERVYCKHCAQTLHREKTG